MDSCCIFQLILEFARSPGPHISQENYRQVKKKKKKLRLTNINMDVDMKDAAPNEGEGNID